MNRSHKYISILLERLPKWELRSYEHQTTLDQIRDRITSAADINAELNSLYRVKGFDEFALSLMWIVDKVEKDSTLDESTLAEENLVFDKLRYALGDVPIPQQDQTAESESSENPSPPGFESALPDSSMPAIPMQDTMATPDVLLDSWGKEPQDIQQPAVVPQPLEVQQPPAVSQANTDATIGSEQERSFAALLERMLESIQSGSDERNALLSDVRNECNVVVNAISAPEEYKQFCKFLLEFLNYVTDNQFLDDIRVMNIVSNIQDPLSQWTHSESAGRANLLDSAIEILRDFKTMFE
ncbi:MAG: hypothetical protein JXA06_04755 [Bacteroidetes bacterium]|nr:hypothetical protein [Bacteroidota bacterium]